MITQKKKILPENIQIIDSGQAVARQTQKILHEKVGLSNLKTPEPVFYSNTNAKVLFEILKEKYSVEQIDF